MLKLKSPINALRGKPKLGSIEAAVRDASRSRRERDRETLRATILHEAGSLFVELGYDQFSMRKVAARIGYSATTIYNHFQDKDALLMALMGEAFCSFSQSLDDAVQGQADPVSKMSALGSAYVRYARENPVFYNLMFLRRPDYLLDREQQALKNTRNGYSILLETVEQMQKAGYYQDHETEAVANAMWASTHGLVTLGLTVFQGQPDKIEAASRVVFQLDPKRPAEKIVYTGDTSGRPAVLNQFRNDKEQTCGEAI